MFGSICIEREVNVAASEAWKLYGSLRLAKIVAERLPNFISKIDIVQGEGGTGTILELFFAPGTPGITWYKQRWTMVDNEKRVREAEVVEGGFLDQGFTLYRFRMEVIEKEGMKNQCITKSTIEYELKEEAAANASLVSIQLMVSVMQLAADYLLQN